MKIKYKNKILENIPRHFFILGIFLISFFLIIHKVYIYTIRDHTFYTKKADIQQIGERKISITRGNIISKNNSNALFATSVHLNDLAIDPTQIGNKNKLASFLENIIFRETCIKVSPDKCKDNILKFLKKTEIEKFQYNEKYIKDLILKRLYEKINQKYRTSILIAQKLDKISINRIKKINLIGVYPNNGNLYINPEEIINKKLFAKKLSPIISYSTDILEKLAKRKKVQYIPFLKRISIDESSFINKRVNIEKKAVSKGFLKKEESIYKFLILTPNPHRLYPENKIASQVLGFVDSVGKGHYGIEGYFDDILKGKTKEKISRTDIKGRVINPINLNSNKTSRSGVTIYTTIDRNIQKNVENILKIGVKKFRANKGSIIVMNPKNGKILAMANYPKFNPNKPGEVYELKKLDYKKYIQPQYDLIGKGVFIEDDINGKEFYINGQKKLLRKAKREELGNRTIEKYIYKNDFGAQVYRNSIISDLYEPGSIMKAFTMAIGIDSNEITKNTFYQNNGPIKIDNFKISDISRNCRGYHSFAHALNYSCNVGMVRIVQKIGKALLFDYLEKFGFGHLTDIELEGEVTLPIKNYEKWSRAQLFTSSYGLGINVNQLQMAVAYSSLVNGGLILKPQIIDKIDFGQGNISKYKTEIIRKVITEKTSKTMINILVNSIEHGVANHGKVEGYSLGGKTGTSQIAYRGKYEDKNMPGATNASFAGFGPAQDPKFVIIVKLRRPRTNNYGGLTSSYLFADVAKYLLDYYRIPKMEK